MGLVWSIQVPAHAIPCDEVPGLVDMGLDKGLAAAPQPGSHYKLPCSSIRHSFPPNTVILKFHLAAMNWMALFAT